MKQHLSILFTVVLALAGNLVSAEEVTSANCERLAQNVVSSDKYLGKDVQLVLHFLRAQNIEGLEAEVVHPGETGQVGLTKPRLILNLDNDNKFAGAHCG